MFIKLQFLWAKAFKRLAGVAIKNSQIHSDARIMSGSHLVDSIVGAHSYCGYDCKIYSCSIGRFCSIAAEVSIGGGNHPMNWVSTSPAFYNGRNGTREKFGANERPVETERQHTIIGHDVWIGEKALIKQGVTIGVGAVVAMGSVVVKNVPPYAIVGGCPARVIRFRFDPELIKKLIASQWWTLSKKELGQYASLIPYPDKFVEKVLNASIVREPER